MPKNSRKSKAVEKQLSKLAASEDSITGTDMEKLDICNMTSSQPVLPYIVITHISQLQGRTLTTPIIYTHPIGEQQHRNRSHIQPISIQQALPPELQQLSVCKEELPPEQQERGPGLGQEEPGPPHIKEEEEEFPVKTEQDEECAQWSQLHQRQTEVKREAEAVASTSTQQMETQVVEIKVEVDPEDPAAALEPGGAEQLLSSRSSEPEPEPEPETEDSDGGWMETTEPPSAEKPQLAPTQGFSCPECLSSFASPVSDYYVQSGSSELSLQQPGSGAIRAESHPVGTSGATRQRKDLQQIHTCNRCGKSLISQKQYDCEQCGKIFTAPSFLKKHQLSHTGEKPYPCEQCGKRFSQLGHLKQHWLMHKGEKPYPCDHCGKRFSQLGTFTRHQLTHTGKKPYPCEQCGKRFSRSGTLKQHQRTHTGEKPYSCELCGKRFSHLGNLKSHQRTHTGEKPYSCEQCGRSFNDSGNLKKHQRIHTRYQP